MDNWQYKIEINNFMSLDEIKKYFIISTWSSNKMSNNKDNVNVDGNGNLQLIVSNNGTINSSGFFTKNNDILYGSFRIGTKITSISGTCFSLFYYDNKLSQTSMIDNYTLPGDIHSEIDVEILSKENKVHYAIHPVRRDIHEVAYNTSVLVTNPNINLTNNFHEHRFDWYNNSVMFYVDNIFQGNLTSNIPQTSGKLTINHWSAINSTWTGTPPLTNTYVLIKYINFYYNRTNKSHQISSSSKIKYYFIINLLFFPFYLNKIFEYF